MGRICLSLTDWSEESLAAARLADLVELRLDILPEVSDLASRMTSIGKPLLITDRRPDQAGGRGGARLDEAARLARLKELSRHPAVRYVDIELGSHASLGELPGGVGRVISSHDFERTPAARPAVCRTIAAAGADGV